MFNTKRPITKVEDLSGMKIRSGGGISEQMARALGASAFVKPAPESYELLSSGVADGTFFPLESIISFKLGPVVKYATLFPGGFYGSAFGFFMNEDKWNKLSKADQDAIMSVSGEALARLAGKAWDATDRAALEVMKQANIQIQEASPELVKGVNERSKAIIDKWKADAKAKGVDGDKVFAEFHEELKRVAAGK
jgi:TRAP-type C4-dicarboxylate transport system substrate-binding protein